ncbi:MAG TPA: gamma carbonic anhydrase family protein [Thermoanaerobaculia bacterium]|nr:gamma carbonic anhydrase family protein [Thermoanaerobaculia bacterium]
MLIRPFKGVSPRLGERVFVAETAAIIGDVEIGDDCSIWYGTVLRGDIFPIRIGARTNIQDNCTLHVTAGTWPVVLEEEVTLGHGVIAHGCVVRRGSLIGMGATLLDGVVVGEESIVAAGALVKEGTQVPPRSLIAGFPATVRRALTAEDLQYLGKYHRHYLEYKESYLAEPRGERR